MNIELYTLFFVTTILLIAVPGPSAMLASSHGASLQSKKAFIGILGIASADGLFFALSATGIATIIIASSTVFITIKWIGVLFLVYLGLSILFSQTSSIRLAPNIDSTTSSRNAALGNQNNNPDAIKLFSQGLFIQLANPKALMYFSALLPQFIDPNQPLIPQLVIMGLTCFIADLIMYSLYAYLGAHLAKQKLKSWVINLINKMAAFALIYTAFKMALIDNK